MGAATAAGAPVSNEWGNVVQGMVQSFGKLFWTRSRRGAMWKPPRQPSLPRSQRAQQAAHSCSRCAQGPALDVLKVSLDCEDLGFF